MLIKDIETLNHEKKIRGFFTVTVYIFAVSFLAILLSIYYIFVWTNPNIQAYCWYMKVEFGYGEHHLRWNECVQCSEDECIWLFPMANVERMTNVCMSVKNVIDSVNHTDCQSVPAVPNKHATPQTIKQIQFTIKSAKNLTNNNNKELFFRLQNENIL